MDLGSPRLGRCRVLVSVFVDCCLEWWFAGELDRSEVDEGRDRTARLDKTLVVFSLAMVAKDNRLLRDSGSGVKLSLLREGTMTGKDESVKARWDERVAVSLGSDADVPFAKGSAGEEGEDKEEEEEGERGEAVLVVVEREELTAGGRTIERAVMYPLCNRFPRPKTEKFGRWRK